MLKTWLKRAISSSADRPLLKYPRALIGRAGSFVIRADRGTVVSFRHVDRQKIFDLIWEIKKIPGMLFGITTVEAFSIYNAVVSTAKVPGDIAELGVFKGGSARLICEVKGQRALHLFDTFKGLPPVDEGDFNQNDNTPYHEGQFTSPLKEVREYLRDFQNIHFYGGLFPGTARTLTDKTFSFVHLDVDTYTSTRDALRFFYPRMSPGGLLISHDYLNATGVRKAFDEFFADRPEPIVPIAETQCLIAKVAELERAA